MISEPINVTDAAFEKTILKSTIPVLVDFWAPWCVPCKSMTPIFEKLAKEFSGKLLVTKVNVDEQPEWAMKYGIQHIPTMLFFANGKIAHTHSGALPEVFLRDIVNDFLDVASQK